VTPDMADALQSGFDAILPERAPWERIASAQDAFVPVNSAAPPPNAAAEPGPSTSA
jgi:hypothetical protein